MANAALDAVMAVGVGGVQAAQVAVLSVLGAAVVFAAASFGTRKIAILLGADLPPLWPDGVESGLGADQVFDHEYASYLDSVKRDARVDSWSDASGLRPADFVRWVN